MNNLQYGAAYFPFLRATLVQDADINFLYLGGAQALTAVLPDANAEPLRTILSQIQDLPTPNAPDALRLEDALRTASDAYRQLRARVLGKDQHPAARRSGGGGVRFG